MMPAPGRGADTLLLLDLHHGAHLLLIQLEVVRFFGVLPHQVNEPPLIDIAHLESAYAANHFRHWCLLARVRLDHRDRSATVSLREIAGSLQRGCGPGT